MLAKTSLLNGKSDSPTWKRGNFSRSKTATRRPCLASTVAHVDPPGPPPQTTTSSSSGNEVVLIDRKTTTSYPRLDNGHRALRRYPHIQSPGDARADTRCDRVSARGGA